MRWSEWSFTTKLIALLGVTWSVTQVYTAASFAMDIFQVQVFHLAFAIALTYLMKPWKCFGVLNTPLTVFTAILSLASGFYFFFSYDRIITRVRFADPVFPMDVIAGAVLIILLIEAGRRLMGAGLACLILIAITYCFVGPYLPASIAHSSTDFEGFIEFMLLTQEGVFGLPLRVSATFVFLFILFGSCLQHGRLGNFYNDMAVALAGGFRGGSAKVAVLSSALLGTISGSATANVTTSGPFTIPMMKKSGFHPITAAAIEAVSSTGSQLVPPIMGAAAFLMAELTGISYWDIALAAIIPSILFYLTIYLMVHYEAVALGLQPEGREKRAEIIRGVWKRLYMLIPVAVIVWALASGYTMSTAAMMAICGSIVISICTAFVTRNPGELFSLLFALRDGAKSAVSVAIPCGMAGIIVGVLTLTGLSVKFSSLLLVLGQNESTMLWVVTAVTCIILGMGMPSAAAYITVAILAIPALVKSGAPLMTAHFLGFYYANMSMITPPVALAAYAAGGLAGEDSNKVGLKACWIGLFLYAIPFMFISYPSLLLMGSWEAIAYDTVKACAIVICFVSAQAGMMFKQITPADRIIFVAAGLVLWLGGNTLWVNALGWLVMAFGVWRAWTGAKKNSASVA